MSDPAKTYRKYYKRILSVSISEPAVRCMIVFAWVWDEPDETGATFSHQFIPVVGIKTVVQDIWISRTSSSKMDYSHIYPNALGAYESTETTDGLQFHEQEIKMFPVFVNPDCDELDDFDDHCDIKDCNNGDAFLVACPWPSSDDDERLKPFIEKARNQAELKRQAKP